MSALSFRFPLRTPADALPSHQCFGIDNISAQLCLSGSGWNCVDEFLAGSGPLNDDNIWHFDFLNHVYTISLIIFAFPLAIATSTRPVMEVFVGLFFFLFRSCVLADSDGRCSSS